MSLKSKVEAIIYAAEDPVTLDQIAALLRDTVLVELAAERAASAEQSAEMPAEAPAQTEPPADTAPVEIATSPDQPPAEAPAAEPEKPATQKKVKDPELAAVKAKLRTVLAELTKDFEADDHGIEIREIAGGYRMATKPEHHDVVVGFAKSLKPPIRLSLPALETLAVIAYKQPVTVPEVSEIRGVDSSGVIATLLDRKLITTSGRKQVIGRPMLYKTTKEFLLRFGLKDVSELPSMEEFEKLGQAELLDVSPQETPDNSQTQPEAAASEPAVEPGAETMDSVPDPAGNS